MGNETVGLGNSERIRLKFGSYGIEVLESGQGIRVSNLYSMKDGVRTNRTFAVVAYPDVIEPEFIEEHDAIIKGQSIGNVFRRCGWSVDKRHQYFGRIEWPSTDSNVELIFGDIGDIQPVVHVYCLFVSKNDCEFRYASIAEVHHPQYLDMEDLNSIYGDMVVKEHDGERKVDSFLEIVRAKMAKTQAH